LPVYPRSPEDPTKGIHNAPFLSEEFLGLVGYAAGRAKELGLTLDLTLGSGWPYGGPWITPELGGQRGVGNDGPALRQQIIRLVCCAVPGEGMPCAGMSSKSPLR
jgi:hypothetical protein